MRSGRQAARIRASVSRTRARKLAYSGETSEFGCQWSCHGSSGCCQRYGSSSQYWNSASSRPSSIWTGKLRRVAMTSAVCLARIRMLDSSKSGR